jgi:cAMP phosphodiesterase
MFFFSLPSLLPFKSFFYFLKHIILAHVSGLVLFQNAFMSQAAKSVKHSSIGIDQIHSMLKNFKLAYLTK